MNARIFNDMTGPTPPVLKWARERLNYSAEKVAEKFPGRDAAGILAWESGDKIPTYPQMETLADTYHVPLAVFFFPEPPQMSDIKKSLRTLPPGEVEQLLPDTLHILHRAEAIQDVLREMNYGTNPFGAVISQRVRLMTDANVVSIAKEIRGEEFLNINVREQKGWLRVDESLNSWRSAVERNGVFVFRHSFEQERVSGFCVQDDVFPLIYLNSKEAKVRQIFTLMHELAHVLLGTSDIAMQENKAYIGSLSSEGRRIENLCDRFAAEVLVPSEDFAEVSQNIDIADETVFKNAARRYWVSERVILRKFLDAKLISTPQYWEKAEEWNSRNAPKDKKTEAQSGNYYNNNIARWGKSFLTHIFDMHRENRIGLNDLTHLLGVKIGTLHKLEDRLHHRIARD